MPTFTSTKKQRSMVRLLMLEFIVRNLRQPVLQTPRNTVPLESLAISTPIPMCGQLAIIEFWIRLFLAPDSLIPVAQDCPPVWFM